VAAEVYIDVSVVGVVLFSHGARFGGHALYVKDGKLKYVYNFVGSNEQIVESTREIPTGKTILGATFVREGDSMPTTGTLSLFIGDEKVGEGRIMTQPGNFSLAGEGLNVGKDPAEPVTGDYPGKSPYAFTGGTIKEAVVDVSGDQYVDLEREALAMMKREESRRSLVPEGVGRVDPGCDPGRDARRRDDEEKRADRDQSERPPGRDHCVVRRAAGDGDEREVHGDADRDRHERGEHRDGGVGA